MSYTATYEILSNVHNVNAGQKLVLSVIASYANNKNLSCFPSVAAIAERCRLTARTVQRHIASLIKLGFLERVYRKGTSAITRLKLPRTPTPTPSGGYDRNDTGGYDKNDTLNRSVESVNTIAPLPTPEPQHQHTTDITAVSPPLLFSEIPEQPEPPTATVTEAPSMYIQRARDCATLLVDVIDQPLVDLPLPAHTATTAASQDVTAALPPTTEVIAPVGAIAAVQVVDANQDPAIEADPVEAAVKALASLPKTLLDDMAMIRASKKRPRQVTRTEAQILTEEAKKAGWTLEQVIVTMICHGWARFQADWVEHVPPQTAPGTPAVTKVWQPEPHTPASASTVATWREKIAAMKARWREESLNAQPPMRQ